MIYRAMAQNEMKEFLLGIGVYRYISHSDMGPGEDSHYFIFTEIQIEKYLREHPDQEQVIFTLMDKTLVDILEDGGAKSTLECSMYIWWYFIAREEEILKTEWKFSERLLALLRERYNQYLESGADFRHSKDGPETVKYLMEVRARLLKERFGFEIC